MTRQAADARTEWWRLFLGEREKALAVQRQAVRAAMQTKARRRQLDDPEPEASDHAVEETMANQHDFFHSLPEALKEQIAANMDETPFYTVGELGYSSGGEKSGAIGWLSQMSPATQEKFKTAMQDYINDHLAPAPAALQKYATQARQDLAAFDPSRVYFQFQNYGLGVMATPFNGPAVHQHHLRAERPPDGELPSAVAGPDGAGRRGVRGEPDWAGVQAMGRQAAEAGRCRAGGVEVRHVSGVRHGGRRADGMEAVGGLPALARLAQHAAQAAAQGA